MTSTPSLTCRIPRSAWLDAFAMRLGELTPEVSPSQPAPGKVTVQHVSGHRRRAYIDLFDPALCVAMRAPRPLLAAQHVALEAGRRQHTHARCWGCDVEVDKSRLSQEGRCPECVTLQAEQDFADEQAERLAELQALFASALASTAFLDCETTGLGLDAQLVDELLELDVVDQPGATLFHSLVKPDKRTEWPEAQEIHGISPTDVAGAPSIAALMPRLEAVLVGVDPGRDLQRPSRPLVPAGVDSRDRRAEGALRDGSVSGLVHLAVCLNHTRALVHAERCCPDRRPRLTDASSPRLNRRACAQVRVGVPDPRDLAALSALSFGSRFGRAPHRGVADLSAR